MTKPRLIILSDLFGGKAPDWVKIYADLLKSEFEIQYYDVLELAGINADNLVESDIHNQFLSEGMDRAVETLLKLENDKVTVLGFSIGGTIGWKASLKGLNIVGLFAVSSTRLRYETEAPNCSIKLYFGEEDSNRPDSQWFLDLNVVHKMIKKENHQLYRTENNAFLVCNDILKTLLR
ncbi:alpha/beta hydrolase [Flavobacterium sp. T12S277]|uniref:alpha/beta hydrolase n=1 Tax=Flavobacterium sp. T12S277 TaxID=3402752 RepID=UPI003AEEAA68